MMTYLMLLLPQMCMGNQKRQEWAVQQLKYAKASNLGLNACYF
jgi:hypothetical protein